MENDNQRKSYHKLEWCFENLLRLGNFAMKLAFEKNKILSLINFLRNLCSYGDSAYSLLKDNIYYNREQNLSYEKTYLAYLSNKNSTITDHAINLVHWKKNHMNVQLSDWPKKERKCAYSVCNRDFSFLFKSSLTEVGHFHTFQVMNSMYLNLRNIEQFKLSFESKTNPCLTVLYSKLLLIERLTRNCLKNKITIMLL